MGVMFVINDNNLYSGRRLNCKQTAGRFFYARLFVITNSLVRLITELFGFGTKTSQATSAWPKVGPNPWPGFIPPSPNPN